MFHVKTTHLIRQKVVDFEEMKILGVLESLVKPLRLKSYYISYHIFHGKFMYVT